MNTELDAFAGIKEAMEEKNEKMNIKAHLTLKNMELLKQIKSMLVRENKLYLVMPKIIQNHYITSVSLYMK